MGAFLGFLWCFERLFVKAPSGRKRFNVLAALNAITHEVIFATNDSQYCSDKKQRPCTCPLNPPILGDFEFRTPQNWGLGGRVQECLDLTKQYCNDSYINALSVCELPHKLAELNLAMPITLVLNNARYQKCQIVTDLAKALDIELLYLPSYSPNLNLIERLWKFVKKQCLYSKYYEDFTLFQNAISKCVENARITHKKRTGLVTHSTLSEFQKGSGYYRVKYNSKP